MAESKITLHLIFVFLLFSYLTLQSNASLVSQSKDSNRRILHLPLHRVNRLATSSDNKIFQDHMLGAPGTGYVIHIWLGTPPQKVSYVF